MLDSFILPAWAFSSLERVANLDCADVSVIVLNGLADPFKYKPGILSERAPNITYRILGIIDKAIFHRGPDAFAPRNVRRLFPNTPVIRVKPEDNAGGLNASDMMELERQELDVLIRMGFDDLPVELRAAAKFGVWSYYHGNARVTGENLPGFWEAVNREPETRSMLCVVNDDSAIAKVLCRTSVQTFVFSPYRNRNRCFWASSPLLPRQIELLHRLGEKAFFAEIEKHNQVFKDCHHPGGVSPSNFLVLYAYVRILCRIIRGIFLGAVYQYYWFLLFDTNDALPPSFNTFEKIIPPKDRFWADPHLIQKNGINYVFIEEYVYRNRKGHISLIEIDSRSHYKAPVPVLVKDYHLSYPFVFEYQNRAYMVPESSQNSTIDLYECMNFPTDWKFKMSLMSGVKAVDTTLFHYQGKWWLFTGITENEGAFPEVELFLFYSDELFTTRWKSHALNPVVSDVTASRPAGKLFIDHGKIFRPSQDCSKLYGHGFNISEVQEITQSDYCEKKIIEIKPHWDRAMLGTHTYSSGDKFTVIDGFSRRSRFH